MKYIIEEYNHANGAKTYNPWIVKESFFGLKSEKYPIHVKFANTIGGQIISTGLKYEFYDLDEDVSRFHYEPTADLEYVKELIEQHKLWTKRNDGSKIKTTKIIEVK